MSDNNNPFTQPADPLHVTVLGRVFLLMTIMSSYCALYAEAGDLSKNEMESAIRLAKFANDNFGNRNPDALTYGEAYSIALMCKSEGRGYVIEVDAIIRNHGGNSGDMNGVDAMDELLANMM